jgi:O-antigen/teichoic acid export membrane protein
LINLPFLAVLGRGWGVPGAAVAYLVAVGTTYGLGVLLWRRATPQLAGVRGHFDRQLLLRTSLPLFWAAFVALVMTWTDTFLLGLWADSRAVGLYGAALRLSLLTTFVLRAVNSVAAPRFSALYARRELVPLGRLTRRTAAITTALAVPLLTLFLLFPGSVLALFGPEFPEAALALRLLAVGQFINVATGPVGNLLMMSGHEQTFRKVSVVAAGLNVALNLLLIPRYGIAGAATATAAGVAAVNLGCLVMVYRKLSILTLPLPAGRIRHAE